MKRLHELLFSSIADRLVFLTRLCFVLFCSGCLSYGMSGILLLRMIAVVTAHQKGQPPPSDAWVGFLFVVSVALCLIILVYLIFYAAVPRLFSMGLPKWYATLVLLPYFKYLFLLFLLVCPPDAFAKSMPDTPEH